MILCVKKKKEIKIDKPLTEVYGWAKNKKLNWELEKKIELNQSFGYLKKKKKDPISYVTLFKMDILKCEYDFWFKVIICLDKFVSK